MATNTLYKDRRTDTDIGQTWKCIIKRKYPEIIDHLDEVAIGGLTDRLLSVDVISLSHREKIYAKLTREDRARALVDTVIDQGEHGCEMFVQQMCQLEPRAMKDLHRMLDNMHSSHSQNAKATLFDEDILKAWSSAQKDDYTILFSSLSDSLSEDMKMRLGPINKWINKARDELVKEKSESDQNLVHNMYTKIKGLLFDFSMDGEGTSQSVDRNVSHKAGQATEIQRLVLAELLRKVSESAAHFVLQSSTDEEKHISIRVFEYLKMKMLHCFEHLPIPFETTRESSEVKVALIDGKAFTTYERTFYVNMNTFVPYKTPTKRSRIKGSNLFQISFDKTKGLRLPSHNNMFNCFRPVRTFEYLAYKDGTVAGRIGRDHETMCCMSQAKTFKFLKAQMKDHFPDTDIQDGMLRSQPCLYFKRLWGQRTAEIYRFVPALSLPIVSTSEEGKETTKATEYTEEFVFDSSSGQCAMKLNRTGTQSKIIREKGFNFSKILSLTKCYLEEENIVLDETLIGNAMLLTVNGYSENQLRSTDELSFTTDVISQLSKLSKESSYDDYITPGFQYSVEHDQEQKLAKLEDITVNKLLDRRKNCESSSPKFEYILSCPNENDDQDDAPDAINEKQSKVVVDSIDQLILNPNQNDTSARLFKTCMVVFSSATFWMYTALYNVNVKWKLVDVPAEIIKQVLALGFLLNLCFVFNSSKFIYKCSLAICCMGISSQWTGMTNFMALEDTLMILLKYCINRWEITAVIVAFFILHVQNFFGSRQTVRNPVACGTSFVVYCHALKERKREFWNMATVKMGGSVNVLIWLWNLSVYSSWSCIKIFRLSVINFHQSKVALRIIPVFVTFSYVYLFKTGTVFGHQRDLRFGLGVFIITIIASKFFKNIWYLIFLSIQTDMKSKIFYYNLPIPLPNMFHDPVSILTNLKMTPLHVTENIENYVLDLSCPFNLCLLFTAYKVSVYWIGMIVITTCDMPYSLVTGGVNLFDTYSILFVYSITYYLIYTLHFDCTFTEPVEDIFFDAIKAPSSNTNRQIDLSKIPKELLAWCAIEGFDYFVCLKCIEGVLPYYCKSIVHWGIIFFRIYLLQQSTENITLEMFDNDSK